MNEEELFTQLFFFVYVTILSDFPSDGCIGIRRQSLSSSALVPERGVEHVPSSVLSGLAKMGQYKFYGGLKQYPLLFFCKCRHY